LFDVKIQNSQVFSIETYIDYDEDSFMFDDEDNFQNYISKYMLENNADLKKESSNYIYFLFSQKNMNLLYDLFNNDKTKIHLQNRINDKFTGFDIEIEKIDPSLEDFNIQGGIIKKIQIFVFLKNKYIENLISDEDIKKLIINTFKFKVNQTNRRTISRDIYIKESIFLLHNNRVKIESEIILEKKLTIEEINNLTKITNTICHVNYSHNQTKIKATNIYNIKELQNG
jgi:hypothetical protein